MRIEDAVNIEDLHRMAKRRLPKIAFDFIEGGLEDERGLERNTSAFHKHRLLPRYLVDVARRDQSQTLFGRTYSSPFGISPTGAAESHLLRTRSAAPRAQHDHRIHLRGRPPFPLHDAHRLRPARSRRGDPAGTREWRACPSASTRRSWRAGAPAATRSISSRP